MSHGIHGTVRFAREIRPPDARGERTLITGGETGVRATRAACRAGLGASLGLCAVLLWLQPVRAVSFEPFELQEQALAAIRDKAVESGIREALQAYEAALESLDADAVKKIQPSIDVEGLKRAFREMRLLEVDIDNIRLLSGDETLARVSCRVAQTLTPAVGSRQTTTVTRVLRLRHQAGGWVILSFER